jgi:hypothetical protein
MAGRTRAAVVALVITGLLVIGTAPAFARFGRTAAEAINPTEACPKYLSLEVASMAPDEGPSGPVVTIQAYAPASEFRNPAALVLQRTIPVREVEPDLTPLANDPVDPDPSPFGFHGRAVLPWNVGRLAPGTTVAVTTPDAGDEFVPVTFSQRCDPPNVRLSRTCSTTGGPHTWRVRNPEAFAVDFNAKVLGTRPARVEIGTAPANGVSDPPFTTQVAGPDIVVLFVGGIPVDVGICLR